MLQSRLEPAKWLLRWILCFPKEAWRNQRVVNHSRFVSSFVLMKVIPMLAPGPTLCRLRPQEGRDKQEQSLPTSSLASR